MTKEHCFKKEKIIRGALVGAEWVLGRVDKTTNVYPLDDRDVGKLRQRVIKKIKSKDD